MRFLSRDALGSQDAFPLAPLIEEAYQEACKYQPAKATHLDYDTGNTPIVLAGDRAALKHALAEVMLNALQANPADPKVGVQTHAESNGKGLPGLRIDVQDNGAGFTPEVAQKTPAPFFTTRNVGLGLGLTVSRKIIETHRGKLEIIAPKSGQGGAVRISLPLDASLTAHA
jgi:signal transduction histidine kinase